MEVRIPGVLAGRQVRDFEIPGEICVASIERLGQATMPLAGTAFEEDDIVHVVVLRHSMDKFRKIFFMA